MKYFSNYVFDRLANLSESFPPSSKEVIDSITHDLHSSNSENIIGEVFHLISNESVQMHGGIGVTDEYDIGLYLKRARVAEQIFGDSNFHKNRYAELTGY
jgi:alkylation response protein AidB-like acyl-CoA dehydrogenase